MAGPTDRSTASSRWSTFTVEGVIVGDDRSFDRAWFVTVRDDAALDALVASLASADEAHVLVVDRAIDRLVDSVG